jgi:hypothetical protein
MAYFKVLDEIKDSSILNLFRNRNKIKESFGALFCKIIFLGFNFFVIISKKISLWVFLQILKKSYRKAKKNYPDIANIIKEQINCQENIERKSESSLDESSEPTANMLANVFEMLSSDGTEQKILKQFGYFLGKWVYLMDAVDDLEKDNKNGEFNPFIKKLKDGNFDGLYFEEVLNQVLAQIILAYNLLEIKKLSGILDNIVKLGLKNSQEKIIKANKKQEIENKLPSL